MRLDSYLADKNLALSRNKARELIEQALVKVNGKIVTKPSIDIKEEDEVVVLTHKNFVSRSAYKLELFLEELELDIEGFIALDIGSSRGGFTQVLLGRGASEVSAIDVGKDQLHESLRADERVRVYEECDIREFKSEQRFDIVVSDVSFISLHHILKDIDRLAKKDIILLFKPQFEVGKNIKRDSSGVVQDKKAIAHAMVKFEDATTLLGWQLIAKDEAKLSGKEGNVEYCYYFSR
ncbi:MAG: TlyA family RNA methyltransferase [Sulfurimonas sp.]|jgi:23S rRNA (cytidine1920-2'-O)/16S rRNA (cytidine1409-2'-O)-methyltransferase|nr:TlyA family RNA methyltransferase [Sulfurimonadaceae bacterium]